MRTANIATVILIFASLCSAVEAQNIAYESFSGITANAPINGSGSDSYGWTDSGWQGSLGDSRFTVINPLPEMEYQISGGAYLAGGNRGLRIMTAPEPTPNGIQIRRSIPSQNSTFYASFLLKINSIGTTTDRIDFEFASPSKVFGSVRFWSFLYGDKSIVSAAIGQYYGGTGGTLDPGQIYFVVVQFLRFNATNFGINCWVNPTSASQNPNTQYSGKLLSTDTVSAIGLSLFSPDTSGPASSLEIDEIRIGYQWNDVVPRKPIGNIVPDLELQSAKRLRWISEAGSLYQVQFSYDLNNWTNYGSVIIGDGTMKSVFDTSHESAAKFWRVVINP